MTAEIVAFPSVARGNSFRSDPDLASLAASGDRDAFAELVKRHQGRVRGMLSRLSRDSALGDDLAQITFLTAWRRIATYSGGRFASWICSVAYRTWLQEVRRREPVKPGEDDESILNGMAAPDRLHGLKLDLQAALGLLSEQQRLAVTLCTGAGLTHPEAAALTGWPVGTVKSHLNRGTLRLRQLLSDYSNTGNEARHEQG